MAVSGGTTTTGAGNDDDEEVDDEENETEEVRQEKAKIGEDVIVLQPGSRYIRIGKATDAVPLVIPNVIAVKKTSPISSTRMAMIAESNIQKEIKTT